MTTKPQTTPESDDWEYLYDERMLEMAINEPHHTPEPDSAMKDPTVCHLYEGYWDPIPF